MGGRDACRAGCGRARLLLSPLARLASFSRLPVSGMPTAVHHRENDNFAGQHLVIDRVGETLKDCSSHLPSDERRSEGGRKNVCDSGDDRRGECPSETWLALLVPTTCFE